MKHLLFKLLYVLISLLSLFGIAEIIFRIYGYVYAIDFRLYAKELKNSNRLPEDILGYPLNNPSSQALATTSDFSVVYTINSKGLRDKEYPYRKPEGITRIAVFGDSFTFGEGVPYGKRFSDIVESNLPNTEVINFGFPGAPLDRIAVTVVREGFKYNPDYLVLLLNNLVTDRGDSNLDTLFASSNSAALNSIRSPIVSYDNTTVYLKRTDPFFNYNPGFFLRHSYVGAYVYYRFAVYRLMDALKREDKMNWRITSFLLQSKMPSDFLRQTDISDRTVNILNTMHQFATANNMKLIVVNIDTEKLKHFYPSDPPFPFVDLSDPLTEEKKKHRLTFVYDQHYNEKTNAFIADQLTDIFLRNANYKK